MNMAQRKKALTQRGETLKQLGVNYRWSRIVLDETDQSTADAALDNSVEPDDDDGRKKRDPYGIPGDILRPGDRAPEAPGLRWVSTDRSSSLTEKSDSPLTSVFDLFGSTYHTALIFPPSSLTMDTVHSDSLKTIHAQIDAIIKSLDHVNRLSPAFDGLSPNERNPVKITEEPNRGSHGVARSPLIEKFVILAVPESSPSSPTQVGLTLTPQNEDILQSPASSNRTLIDTMGLARAAYVTNTARHRLRAERLHDEIRTGVNTDRSNEGHDELVVVLVRPDGVVGAFISSVQGVERYFSKLLLM